jgi:hypothetical protein
MARRRLSALANRLLAFSIVLEGCSNPPSVAGGQGLGGGGAAGAGEIGGAAGLAAGGGLGTGGAAGGTDAGTIVSRICGLSGRFVAVSPDGSCPSVMDLPTYSPNNNLVFFLGIYSDGYKGQLPLCQNQSPYNGGVRFPFRVDRVDLTSHVVNSTTSLDSTLFGAELDTNPICGMGIWMNSPTEQVSVATGNVLNVASRIVVRSDTDQPGATILYDENGTVLYSYAASVRVDQFAGDLGDLFPGLSIATSSNVICRVPDADISLVTARLVTGSDVCDIDSHSERCCTLWGRTYEVQMIAAFGPSTSQPYPTVTFTLRAPGFFVPAH